MTVNVTLKQKITAPTSCLPFSGNPVETVVQNCIRCGACVEECRFLQNHGIPGLIAEKYFAGDATCLHSAYNCSLCSLCIEVCPQNLPVSEMFLYFRRQAVEQGGGRYRQHKPLLLYEKIGSSKLFSYYHLPQNCDTVFFPGCALPGIRPKQIIQLFNSLKNVIPTLGLVLDCCNKPSHDLGFQKRFVDKFKVKTGRLRSSGVKKIITTCPSCFQIFQRYGEDLEISTAYTILATEKRESPEVASTLPYFTVHDPCVLRFEEETQKAVRALARKRGVNLVEMDHNRRRTYCCGAGAAAHYLSKGDSNWTDSRCEEAGNTTMITYCAGCTSMFGGEKAMHLIDLLFPPQEIDLKPYRLTSPPFTYLNRLLVKIRSYFSF